MSCNTGPARQRTLPHDGADNRTEMRGGAIQFIATVRIFASRSMVGSEFRVFSEIGWSNCIILSKSLLRHL
jgi:hypothetical protein